jgi:hypothetical protein
LSTFLVAAVGLPIDKAATRKKKRKPSTTTAVTPATSAAQRSAGLPQEKDAEASVGAPCREHSSRLAGIRIINVGAVDIARSKAAWRTGNCVDPETATVVGVRTAVRA